MNLSRVTDFYVTKYSISNKCCSFECSIHQRIPILLIKISTNILSSTTVLICTIDNYNKKKFLSSTKFMISERSCDTEDLSNEAENSALPSQE